MPIDTPEILTSEAIQVAKLYLNVPTAEIRQHMGDGLARVRAAIAAQGLTANGPWLTHHYKIPDDMFDYEICIPVTGFKDDGDVKAGEIPSTRVARTVYHGDYAQLGAGWGEFLAWLKTQNLTGAGDFWEVYAIDPSGSANPADWQTQLNVPLV